MGAPAGLTPAPPEVTPTREVQSQRWRVKQTGAQLEVVIAHGEGGNPPALKVVSGTRGQILEGIELSPAFVERYEAGEAHARSLVTRLSDDAPAGGEAPLEEVYDPSQHTVDDVQDYLDEADAEERQRVLDAEAAGDGRKGILSYNPDPLAGAEDNPFTGDLPSGGGQ